MRTSTRSIYTIQTFGFGVHILDDVTIDGDLTVSGDLSFDVSGDITVDELTATGDITGANLTTSGDVESDNITASGSLVVGDDRNFSTITLDQRVGFSSGYLIGSNVLPNNTDIIIAKVQVADSSNVSIRVFLHIFQGSTATNLSAARMILYTAHADSDGNIVSAATIQEAGPDALGAEYASLTISADTNDDAANDLVELRIKQVNDLTNEMHCIISCECLGSTGTSAFVWNNDRLLHRVDGRHIETQDENTLSATGTVT